MRHVLTFLMVFVVFHGSWASGRLAEKVVIDEIVIKGNNKTLREVLLREMEIGEGDSLSRSKLKKALTASENNLMNTGLFNFVEISFQNKNDRKVVVEVEVTEQWYTWVVPMFEMVDRNFNTWWQTKDFSRADMGLLFIQKNFRGRREEVNVKGIAGHNEYFNLKYDIPYLDKKKRIGLLFEAEAMRSHEAVLKTYNDEQVFYNDESIYPIKRKTLNTSLLYRRKIRRKHLLTIGYQDYQFADTVLTMNPDFLMESGQVNAFISLRYQYVRDYRDYISYPLTGDYLDLSLQKTGLGFLNDGSVDFWRFRGYYSRYEQLSKRWFASAGLLVSLSEESNHPYFLKNGLGLGYAKEFVRSYEYNVINGNHYGLLRSNLKYALVPTKTLQLNFIPWEQFSKVFYAVYLNAFFDAGYADPFSSWQSNNNNLPGKLLTGKGIGLDIVTYYEKVFRLEYSWNNDFEGGFFVHFVAPI